MEHTTHNQGSTSLVGGTFGVKNDNTTAIVSLAQQRLFMMMVATVVNCSKAINKLKTIIIFLAVV